VPEWVVDVDSRTALLDLVDELDVVMLGPFIDREVTLSALRD
jgi:hypothetical protein